MPDKKKLGLTAKIVIGMTMGILLGLALNFLVARFGTVGEDGKPHIDWIDTWLIGGVFELFGTGFIRGIKMLVVPLVIVSLVAGTCSLGDPKKLGRVGIKALLFYLVTTCIAITLALVLANIIDPGAISEIPEEYKQQPTIGQSKGLVETLLQMIPDNPIASFANGAMLQIIVFSILFGTCVTLIGEKGQPLVSLISATNDVVMKMVWIIMIIAPYGIAALLAKTFATLGFDAIFALGKYMITVLLALFIHMTIVYTGMLKLFARLSVIQFFKNIIPAQTVAFSTASSSATLPITIETVEKRMGASNSISSFVLPLGATINMDGTAIMQGVAVVFIAQISGVDLTMANYLTVILAATLASIGTAGIPGVGLIMLSMVLDSVGLDAKHIAMIFGIDRLLDMCRTATNITGDAVCTLVIAKSEKELNTDIYYEKNAPAK
jgi:Na+/H+-dicarboxylate symporter